MHVSLEAISPVETGSQGQWFFWMNFGAVEKQNKKGNILSLIAFLWENSPLLKKKKRERIRQNFFVSWKQNSRPTFLCWPVQALHPTMTKCIHAKRILHWSNKQIKFKSSTYTCESLRSSTYKAHVPWLYGELKLWTMFPSK